MLAGMLRTKKLNPMVTEMFITDRMLKMFFFFYCTTYFAVSKYIRLNSTHNSIMQIPNKLKLKQIAFKLSSDTDFKNFMNPYKKCTAKPYSF